MCQMRRQNQLRLDDAEYQADHDDIADHSKQRADAARDEYYGNKSRHRRQDAEDNWNRNFGGAFDRCGYLILPQWRS